MRLIGFTAKCQSKTITEQYELGVRCFDLRIKHIDGKLCIAHSIVQYEITLRELCIYLEWINSKKDCSIRVVHEIRKGSEYTEEAVKQFRIDCEMLLEEFPSIKFWGGMNLLPQQTVDFEFNYKPTCEEKYASVMPPRILDDWWPWLYARFHNKKILKEGTDKDILMIDYVNIQ